MQTTQVLTSEGPAIAGPAAGGSKLGRSIFPLLLIVLPLVADAAIVRCPAGSCRAAPAFTEPLSRPAAADSPRLEFPFPLAPGTFGGSESSDVGLDPFAEDPAEATEEVAGDQIVAPAARRAPTGTVRRNTNIAPAPASASGLESGVSLEVPGGVPAIPDVGAAPSGERATRQYRSYSPPPDRRTYSSHPDAGAAGVTSSFGGPTAGSQSVPSSSSSSPSTPAAPPPPPPPPPGQGGSGSFSPGEPGEVAGFIG